MDEDRLAQQAKNAIDQEESNIEETVVSGGAGSGGSTPPRMLIFGIFAIVLLIIIGLFLPPISLGARLGLTDSDEDGAPAIFEIASGNETSISGEIELSVAGDADVNVERVAQADFSSSSTGQSWSAAAAAQPVNTGLVSHVYMIEYEGEAPNGSATIQIPAAAQPANMVDLYSWDGQKWHFVASSLSSDGSQLATAEGPLPKAYALFKAAPPAEAAVMAELLPTQELPPAVLPFLSQVSAGTLTLGGSGELLGDVAQVPTGGYSQLLRVSNTGAIVDTNSLSALLSNTTTQDNHIQALVSRVQSGGYAGLHLDYQGATAAQQAAFTTFIEKLAQALHDQNLLLAVGLETPTQTSSGWDTAGQDWAAIGRAADMVLAQMPLDPTAYADNSLAEQMLVWAVRQINRQKLFAYLSVNAVDAVGEAYRELANEQALVNFGELSIVSGDSEVEPEADIEVALSGSAGDLAWDAASLAYRYSYEEAGQEHLVWLGSEAVLSHRSRLAVRYNLQGIALRGLGHISNGEAYAAAIESYLGLAAAPQPASAAIVWAVHDESGGVLDSQSGEALAFAWQAGSEPGEYTISADFAQGLNVSSLGSLAINVQAPPTPTPTPEPTEEPVVEATATPDSPGAAQPTAVDPGNSDAAANVAANVRSGPGLAYGIVDGLQTGEQVSLIGRNSDSSWLQVRKSDDTEGWVFATLLTVNSSVSVSQLAVIEVDPPVVAGGDDDGGANDDGGGAPPPIIPPAGGGSFELGGQTHTFANPSLMSLSGMNWVKFQHKWGPGNTADAVAGRIQQAHANGFKVLLSIPGANTYPSSIDFAGYVQFLGGVAALGPDAIEVWNEMNIDFEWPAGQINPTQYVNEMLAPAYNAIKAANPSVMVISGAPAPTGFDNGTNAWADDRYMAGVAAAGGVNYMDCIGVHYNAGATSPNATTGHPAGNNHYSWYFWPTLNMYYNTFGGARPVCLTELGYLSGQDFGGVPSNFSWAANTTVAQHAQWLAEATSLAANSGKVRMMIIFNVDFTHWGTDPQAGYAMLRPDGSCPSCDLLRQVMGG